MHAAVDGEDGEVGAEDEEDCSSQLAPTLLAFDRRGRDVWGANELTRGETRRERSRAAALLGEGCPRLPFAAAAAFITIASVQ